MKTLIVVPARYGSKRFPGKPLAMIAGQSMVSRVAAVASEAASQLGGASAHVVATDDCRIADHCAELSIPVVMTDEDLPTGTDRALAAANLQETAPDIVVNLQGDAPFTPVDTVVRLAKAVATSEEDAATPVIRLSWTALDALREHKKIAPFSGTTCIQSADGKALWFSKNIIPGLRKEDAMRAEGDASLSPVLRHIGLYAYRLGALERFSALPESHYEKLEGLEQLRLLENGMSIRVIEVPEPEVSTSGIDTIEDLEALEALLAAQSRTH